MSKKTPSRGRDDVFTPFIDWSECVIQSQVADRTYRISEVGFKTATISEGIGFFIQNIVNADKHLGGTVTYEAFAGIGIL